MIGEFKALSVGTSYTFATGDLLDQPNTYFYSAFVGVDFITAWIDSRNACLKYCKQSSKNYFNINLDTCSSEEGLDAKQLLTSIYTRIDNLSESPDDKMYLNSIVRNFEAKKRIYKKYNKGWTSKGRTDFKDIRMYLLFSEVLLKAWIKWGEFPYLNALIKCLDILCAYVRTIEPTCIGNLSVVILGERKAIMQVAKNLNLDLNIEGC